MPPEFEWDADKADENLKKHGVAFEEALTVFADPLARIFDDLDHSIDERRELIVGHSAEQRLLLVSFTDRGRRTRIIGARNATAQSDATMKKTPKRNRRSDSNGMHAEYKLDYSRAKPNRFAARMNRPVVAVVLAPDVASVFDSSAKVNAQLRSVIAARPPKKQPARLRSHRRKAG